ncbi:MAG: type transport system permease protein [Thermoplasmata archaeon]|jgi:ABC-type transport system involved in multi-copper enzyme maturation permease subunit|nr:type transport system permease protein [Thermoplasmata archaeon]
MRVFRSEWDRLMRPGVLLGGAGTIVGSALLVTAILFAIAKPAADITLADAAAGRAAVSREMLEASDGMVSAFGLAGPLLGVICLVLFAQNLGAEYGHGTLKVLLLREPRRLRLLAGKAAALGLLCVLAIAVAFVAQSLLAIVMAAARGIPATAWFQPHGLAVAGLLLLRVVGAALAWGAIGLLLATLLRASAPAVGIGIGYTIVAEPIVSLAFNQGAKYLPGRILQSFVAWGAAPPKGQPAGLDGPVSAVLLLVYLAVMLGVAVTLFVRRDVEG